MSSIVAIFLSALCSIGLDYFWQPALNFTSGDFWWFLFAVSICFIVFSFIVNIVTDECNTLLTVSGIACGIITVFGLIFCFTSFPIFHSDDYRNAHAVRIADKAVALQELPIVETKEDIPIIDVYTASKLGDRAMGGMEKYLSQYEVNNEYSLIEFRGDFFRISPLEYGGFWKYVNSSSIGIPGYVMVNIYTGEAQLIELPPELTIRYAPSSYWGKDMLRNLRKHYPFTLFGDYHFEIDEDGIPYYIISTMRSTAGMFGAKVIDGIIVMNAVNGESHKYALNEVPDWVDNVYSVSQLMKEIAWHFDYVHGVLNFSKKDVRKTSYSFDNAQYYLYPDNNDVILYTGVTSAGNDEANIGFILANMRSGEISYYAAPGAEESSAQASAKGLVQQYGYSSGPVMLVNIDGIESYFLTLKDAQGLVKRYALVNKEDYNVVAVEETIEDVVYSYRKKVSTVEAQGDAGTIESVYTAVIDGNTTYVFKLVGIDTYYLSDVSVSYDQHYHLTAGANVELSYIEQNDIRIVNEITFK